MYCLLLIPHIVPIVSDQLSHSIFCFLGLRHWSPEDDVHIEHARWARYCSFLRQQKGQPFIDLVQLCVLYRQEVS